MWRNKKALKQHLNKVRKKAIAVNKAKASHRKYETKQNEYKLIVERSKQLRDSGLNQTDTADELGISRSKLRRAFISLNEEW